MNYPKTKCDTVIRALERDGNTDVIHMLGLVEQYGHNTRKDRKSGPERVTRKPLWKEPVIGGLSTGQTEMKP